MVSNNDSQCYFVQLQFDAYLDGELGQIQRDEFQSHVRQCPACAQEFKFAQTLHDFVLDLPQLDCNEDLLEPIHRLGSGATRNASEKASIWQGLTNWFDAVPVFPRYALAVLLLVVFIAPVYNTLLAPQPDAPLIAEQSPAETAAPYTPEEIQQALLDLNVAMKYLNDIGLRTEVMIGDRFLVSPIQDSINASLDVISNRRDDPFDNDSI